MYEKSKRDVICKYDHKKYWLLNLLFVKNFFNRWEISIITIKIQNFNIQEETFIIKLNFVRNKLISNFNEDRIFIIFFRKEI